MRRRPGGRVAQPLRWQGTRPCLPKGPRLRGPTMRQSCGQYSYSRPAARYTGTRQPERVKHATPGKLSRPGVCVIEPAAAITRGSAEPAPTPDRCVRLGRCRCRMPTREPQKYPLNTPTTVKRSFTIVPTKFERVASARIRPTCRSVSLIPIPMKYTLMAAAASVVDGTPVTALRSHSGRPRQCTAFLPRIRDRYGSVCLPRPFSPGH